MQEPLEVLADKTKVDVAISCLCTTGRFQGVTEKKVFSVICKSM